MDTVQYLILLLGSNIGDRLKHMETALAELNKRIGGSARTSSIYETEPWGMDSGSWFLNRCISFSTSLEPSNILEIIHDIERGMGRIKESGGYQDRVIDIDILLYGDMQVSNPGLTIPHPKIHERKFVLLPLLEIYPELCYPSTGEKFRDILDTCKDTLIVRKLPRGSGL